MKLHSFPVLLWLALATTAGFCAEADEAGCLPSGTLAQVGTIDALLAGQYDGTASLAALVQQGDLGLGTFDRLDGEMVVLDGVIYRVRGTGEVTRADLTGTTPFAVVCHFEGKPLADVLHGLDFTALKQTIDGTYPAGNVPLAIRLDGRFKRMRTRSVPAQVRPYQPLAEVTKTQPEFERRDVAGVLLGFRLPAFIKGINVPGYHLHFISADRTYGGHVLGFEIDAATAQAEELRNLFIALPIDQDGFRRTDFTKDRARELGQVEAGKR